MQVFWIPQTDFGKCLCGRTDFKIVMFAQFGGFMIGMISIFT